jgi:hypothetical protein
LEERGRRIEGRKKSEVGGQRSENRRLKTESSEKGKIVEGVESVD